MRLRVMLVATLLTLDWTPSTRGLENFTREARGGHSVVKKVLADEGVVEESRTALALRRGDGSPDAVKVRTFDSALAEVDAQESGLPRRKRRHMDRTMLALLMAYKMKFIVLIPALLGGLSLLGSTTLLAGFFFALFATVLGLK